MVPCVAHRSRSNHGASGGSADTDCRKHYDGVIMMEFYKLFHWRKDWPEMLSMEKVLMSGELHARCAEKMGKIDQMIIGAYMMSILLRRN